ncbi:hypothetical protein SAMN05216241_101187 [Limimonas halophila]|uniref:Glutamine amidotransferase domain-containing protein n=1 Tax=Limimonas halophila TaxID=1082479 RepID=A0A1G7LBQ0_9PROT|nr:hypothetical protein [Limimonas halophila]SDF46744.1 hypothetical protein SAMN05216241_101187 [Limimonas halophila]
MNATVAVTWSPLVPAWVLIALAVAAALILALAAWRRARGWGWRALAVVGGLGVLANPTLVQEERDPLADIALIAVDESASQGVGDRRARTRETVDALKTRLDGLDNTETQVVRGGAPETGPPTDGTTLIADIERALRTVPRSRLGGIFVVGDGRVHDVPQRVEALGVDAPVHLVQTGDPAAGDRRLLVKDAPSYGIVGESVEMTVRVEDLGVENGPQRARLTFRRGDGSEQTVQIPVGQDARVKVPVHRRGRIVVAMQVADGPAELTRMNNRAAVTVNGVRDRLRVLLVSGMPHAGERAWRRLLKADPSVDLVHFTILRPPSKQRATPINELSLIAFPTRELFQEKIEEFDLIVFDRYTWRGVLPSLYLRNVADYVRQGGALLVASGASFAGNGSLYRTPLRAVLPAEPSGQVQESAFVPAVTDTGARHPVTADLPGSGTDGAKTWGRWFRSIPTRTASGNTLMQRPDGQPLLVLKDQGEGRVAQLLSDQIWLWARGYDGGGPQQPLMRRVAHWLMNEPALEAEDLRVRRDGDALAVTRRTLERLESPTVTLRTPGGETRSVALDRTRPGRYGARVPIDEVGIHEAEAGEHTAMAAVGAPSPLEYRDVRPSAEPLRPLIEVTGGGVAVLADDGVPRVRKVDPDRSRSGPGWLGVLANGAHRVTGASQVPLLPAAAALILLAALMLAAWYREGR